MKCNFIGIVPQNGYDNKNHSLYGKPYCELTSNKSTPIVLCAGKHCILQRILDTQGKKCNCHINSMSEETNWFCEVHGSI